MTFDAIQARYVGRQLLSLIDLVAAGTIFPPLVAAEVIASAILRIDPSGSVFTSTHFVLAKLAVEKGVPEPALRVIDKDITLYPSMTGPRDTRSFLCDATLSPLGYISPATMLSDAVKSASVLEYHLLCGLIYVGRRDWTNARKSFERVLTHPTKEKGVSTMMTESYKKWVLVGLLSEGRAPTIPAYVPAATKTIFNTLALPYNSVATLFSTDNVTDFKTEVESKQDVWDKDGNLSLMNEVIGAYQEWQILSLERIYQEVPMSRVRGLTLNARTGLRSEKDEDILQLIQKMIDSRMLKGEINSSETGEIFLRFHDDSTAMTETGFAREIARSQLAIKELGRQYQLTNEKLGENKNYVKHLVREQKVQDNHQADASGGFDASIEDEDLMTGVINND
jgi:COP9 signalosome complex subunit 3